MSYTQFQSHRLLLMAKPPADIAALLAGDPRMDARPADRLHVTMLPIGIAQSDLIDRVAAVLGAIEVAPFRVAFDRIQCSGRTVALRGSETMRGAMRAQKAVHDQMIRHGIPLPRYTFHPHITLAYRPDRLRLESLDVISWRVEDVRLIESVTGKGLHIEHGRWPLRAPAGAMA